LVGESEMLVVLTSAVIDASVYNAKTRTPKSGSKEALNELMVKDAFTRGLDDT